MDFPRYFISIESDNWQKTLELPKDLLYLTAQQLANKVQKPVQVEAVHGLEAVHTFDPIPPTDSGVPGYVGTVSENFSQLAEKGSLDSRKLPNHIWQRFGDDKEAVMSALIARMEKAFSKDYIIQQLTGNKIAFHNSGVHTCGGLQRFYIAVKADDFTNRRVFQLAVFPIQKSEIVQ